MHIGPAKSGSTSIQHVLSASRAALLDHGVLYPQGVRPESHVEEICDFLNHAVAPMPPMAPDTREYMRSRPPRRVGSWRRVLDRVATHDGPVVISSENMSALTGELTAELVSQLPSRPVEVVMVSRPASQALASAYQEMSRRQSVPPWEAFVDRAIVRLLSPQPSLIDVLNHRETVRRWSAAGAQVTVVRAPRGLSSHVLQQTFSALVPEITDLPVDMPRANVSLSALGMHVFARHTAAHPPRYGGSALAVLRRMQETFPATADADRGGKLRLRPAFAHMLDRYCDVDTTDVTTAEEVLAAGRDGLVEPAVWETFDEEAALATMRRWQWQEDARWAAMSAASRAIGRGALIRGTFRESSDWL